MKLFSTALPPSRLSAKEVIISTLKNVISEYDMRVSQCFRHSVDVIALLTVRFYCLTFFALELLRIIYSVVSVSNVLLSLNDL